MDIFSEQLNSTQARYDRHHKSREQRLAYLASKDDWRKVDSPLRILHRLESRGLRDVISEAMSETTADMRGRPQVNVLERIFDRSDLTGIAYFYRFSAASRAVARVQVRNQYGGVLWHGTGFLVSPQLLMTNNHVIPSETLAVSSVVQLDYYRCPDGSETIPIEFVLQPQRFFQTDKDLDFTIVAIAESNEAGRQTLDFGHLNMIPQSGKAVVGERVNIVQHPAGRPKEISFRDNQIIDVPEDFLHYRADTQPGSSGSPVLNEDGELAALHHAGVPNRDGGNILLRDGTIWDGSRNKIDDIDWIANEGARISRIVAFLERQQLSAEEENLLQGSFELPPSPEKVLASFAKSMGMELASASSTSPIGSRQAGMGDNRGASVEADGSVSWWLRVNVGPFGGSPATMPVSTGRSVHPAPTTPMTVTSARGGALGSLAAIRDRARSMVSDAWDPEHYYDLAADAKALEAYYTEIDPSQGKEVLFHKLHNLLETTHTLRLSYREARWNYLYPLVDRRESGNLRNIYSGTILDPAEILAAEMALVERHMERLAKSGQEFDSSNKDSIDALELMLEEEYSHPFNCEHVVPQSWFNKKKTPKADLHHLFTCESDCNSFRSNFAYFDFPPLAEATRADCGRREGTSGNNSKFEPEFGRGTVARATLYFLLRYPGEVTGDKSEMPTERIRTLKRWHKAEPVSFYEYHRNAEVFKIQGCHNPLIDNPRWVDKIDFALGLVT